jgi:hypothetical protein
MRQMTYLVSTLLMNVLGGCDTEQTEKQRRDDSAATQAAQAASNQLQEKAASRADASAAGIADAAVAAAEAARAIHNSAGH